ncbi:MAG TPA: hypothetical protein VNK46_06505 [Nitrospiraceae bacterium]|jgi:hypothetical protein|nr:hypothetical protein [Nitrospiraceae bacterium]
MLRRMIVEAKRPSCSVCKAVVGGVTRRLGPAARFGYTISMALVLPQICERALLERFLRAEAMALWSVRSAQARDVPPHALSFLHRHEEDERTHLRQFEMLLGMSSWERTNPPRVPSQWWALAVRLYGYEALGLEFAKLLAGVRPDLASILADEEAHVGFFEREIRAILAGGDGAAQGARTAARAWWKQLPRTVDRYLGDESLVPYRAVLRREILGSIKRRLTVLGLLEGTAESS